MSEWQPHQPKRLPATEAVKFIGNVQVNTKIRTQGERDAIQRDADGHNLREFAAAQFLWKDTVFGEACNRWLSDILRRVRKGYL